MCIRDRQAFYVFGANLEEYMHLVLPVLVGLFERTDAPLPLRRAAIVTVGQLSRKVNFADHASRIVHPLVRVLHSGIVELRTPVLDTLTALVFLLGPVYLTFVAVVNKPMVHHRIQHPRYQQAIACLVRGEALPPRAAAARHARARQGR